MFNLKFLKTSIIDKTVLLSLSLLFVFYLVALIVMLTDNFPPIVKESNIDYNIFILSRIIFEVPIALLIVSIFKNTNYKHYIIGFCIIAIFPTQIIYVSIRDVLSIIFGINFTEQYIRAFSTLIAFIGICFLYIKNKNIKMFFIFSSSLIYILITLFSHILLIENWWFKNLSKQIEVASYIAKENDQNIILKMCELQKLSCYSSDFKNMISNGYEIKDWQVKNLNEMLENKKYLPNYYFNNDILIFTNEAPFISQSMKYSDSIMANIAIKIIFTKTNNGMFILNTNITKEMNNLRFYYGLFNFGAGIVWFLGAILLIRVHRNRLNQKIWFK